MKKREGKRDKNKGETRLEIKHTHQKKRGMKQRYNAKGEKDRKDKI